MPYRIKDHNDLAAAFSATSIPHHDAGDHLVLPLSGGRGPLAIVVRWYENLIECWVSLELAVPTERRSAFLAVLARINGELPIPGFLLQRTGVVCFRAVAFRDHMGKVDFAVVTRALDACYRSVGDHFAELELAAGTVAA